MNEQQLKDKASSIIEYMSELEEKRSTNQEASKIYKEQETKLSNILDELEKLQEERGDSHMKKLETRTNEFESMLREGTEFRNLQLTSDGGAVVPENVHQSIVKKMEEVSPVFAKARKLASVSGDLKVARETASSAGAFVGEGLDLEEGGLDLDFVELKQKRVGAAITLSNQLINDSAVNIEEYASNLLSRRVAKAVEQSMLVGTGGNEFNGVVNDADVASVDLSLVTGATIDTLADLYLAIHPEFLQGAGFIMSRPFFNKIAKLKDQNGHFYIQNGVVNGKLTYTLFGAEVNVTDSLDAGTTDGEVPVVFGNIEEAVSVMIKEQAGLQQISADTKQALRGSKLFLFDMYADAGVVNPQAVAKLNVIA